MYRACLALGLALLGNPLARAADRPALEQALALEQAVQDLIKQAEPSVACILVSRSDDYRRNFHDEPPADEPGKLGGFDPNGKHLMPATHQRRRSFVPDDARQIDDNARKYDLANPQYVPEAYGSGVVLDGKRRLVLTNYHVVRDATKVYVTLAGGKGSYADIYAADPRSDLAVLQLQDESLAPLPEIAMGDGGAVRKGQFVVSLANPFAVGFRDGSPSASWGMVSNLRRRAAGTVEERDSQLQRPLHLYRTLLQTDARLNLGCSGGALLNLRGELIGLTTARAALAGTETAGGFAIPLDAATKRLIARLRDGEEVEYGFLGVTSALEGHGREGLPIRGIVPGSPADQAHLRQGESILSINDIPVQDPDDLFLIVGTLLAGSEVRIEVRGKPRIVPVTLAKFYVPGKVIASRRRPLVRGFRVDYTSVLWMQGYYSGHMQAANAGILPGVYVSEVRPGSRAATARLQVNDVILQVNGQDVKSPADFYAAMEKLGDSEPLKLTLVSAEMHAVTSSTLVIN
jgi:S1-C subfamily serine protease